MTSELKAYVVNQLQDQYHYSLDEARAATAQYFRKSPPLRHDFELLNERQLKHYVDQVRTFNPIPDTRISPTELSGSMSRHPAGRGLTPSPALASHKVTDLRRRIR
jgi:hypothetical protein